MTRDEEKAVAEIEAAMKRIASPLIDHSSWSTAQVKYITDGYERIIAERDGVIAALEARVEELQGLLVTHEICADHVSSHAAIAP
jgi:hypothetical protein